MRERERYLEVGRRESWGDDMPVMDPLVTLGHDQSVPEHGFSVVLEHPGLSPTLPHYTTRHLLQKLRVCNIQEWLRA